MKSHFLTPLLIVGILIWAGGCSERPVDPVEDGSLNLESEFGGYTASAESPGFADPDLLGEADADQDFGDEILASPEADSIIADPQSGYYHLRAVWGRLRYDSTVTTVTDWSGSLSVSRGLEVIRRVIRFEPGQDYIIRPRTDRRLIEWVSKTTVHNDGIAVDIFVPRLRPLVDTTNPDTVPVTVTFETGPYSRTFVLDELQSLDTVVYLDDSNAVAFHALQLHRYPCPRGFLAGHWGYTDDGKGRFRGVWWSQRPSLSGWQISGYLKGHFGRNRAGANVFFGKWISRSGEFEGFLKGGYGQIPGPDVTEAARKHARGWFSGRIFGADRTEIGVLKGKYSSAPRHRNGFFQGRWKVYCIDSGAEPSDREEGF